MGFAIWKHIYESVEGPGMPDHSRATAGRDALYHARECERDRSFLRRFLDEKLIRKLGLFEYAAKKGEFVVTEVADEDGWEKIRDSLVSAVGMGGVPVIKVEDADFEGTRTLLLKHYFDGRELDMENTEKTLAHAYKLWGRSVALETVVAGKETLLVYDGEGLNTRKTA
jgi:stage V sporulation protein R